MGLIPPWSDLPPELISAIAECLNTNPIDILSFRSVCKSWCTSTSFSLSSAAATTLFPPLPLTTPSPPYSICHRYANPSCELALVSVTAIYALRPPIEEDVTSSCTPKAWVLFMDQSVPGKVSIRKPFSRSSYTLPFNFPRNLNLLGFHASELGRFCNLSYIHNEDAELTKSCLWFGSVLKAVLFSNGNGFAVFGLSDEGKLGLLRLGLGYNYENLGAQTQWEIIHDGKGFRFDDIVDFKGRILSIDRRGRVYEVKIGCSSSSKMIAIVPPIAGGGGRRKRLVESLGRLYLVVRCNVRGETDGLFKVYELNEGTKKWVEVKSIGNRTFFFGLEFSFSASAELLHGSYGKNCILFKEQSFLTYSGYDDDSMLFYNLIQHDLHVGVWHMEDAAHISVIGSHPGYSNILWPPPTWIWPNHKSERVGTLITALDRLEMRTPCYEKFKAKFQEFSPPQQKFARTVMDTIHKMKETLAHAREIDKMLKQIELVAVSWKQHCKSANLQNQVGTYFLANEESCASLESFRIIQNAMKHGNSNFDLLSMEMKLHSFILHLEEDTSEVEDTLNSPKTSALIAVLDGTVS